MWYKAYAIKLKYYLSGFSGSLSTIYRYIKSQVEDFIAHKQEKLSDVPDNFYTDPPNADTFNDITKRFVNDSQVLEQISDSSDIIALHNEWVNTYDSLKTRLSKVRSTLMNRESVREYRRKFIASDTFDDFTLVDLTKTEADNRCYLDTVYGVLTLHRVKSENLSESVSSIGVVDVSTTQFPKRNNSRAESSYFDLNMLGTDIFHEGKYYGSLGTAFPEGGSWNLDVDTTSTVPSSRQIIKFTGSALNLTAVPDEYYVTTDNRLVVVLDGTSYGSVRGETYTKQAVANTNNLTVKEILATESGISDYSSFLVTFAEVEDEALQTIRKYMIDGNPVTYWQCEVNKKWEGDYSNDTISAVAVSTPILIANSDNKSDWYWSYLAQSQTVNPFDLSVQVTLTMEDPINVNWISLYPYNFTNSDDTDTPIYVDNLEYSEDGTETWVQVPGFTNLVLTEHINESLDDYQTALLLADNRYEYKGKGIWSFQTITAKKIRFTITQPHPYRLAFEQYKLQLASQSDTVVDSTVTSSARTQIVTLPYLNTVGVFESELDLSSQYSEVKSSSVSTSSTSTSTSSFLIFFNSTNTSTTSLSYSDTGMYLVNKWLADNDQNIARYAIGIREIGLYSYSFDQSSEIYSKEFSTAEPIGEVELEVQDYTPSTFDSSVSWIKYYVNLGDDNWYEINPTNKSYSTVPSRIKIGGSSSSSQELLLDDADKYKIRLKIEMSRPSSMAYDSPKVFWYKLSVYPKE